MCNMNTAAGFAKFINSASLVSRPVNGKTLSLPTLANGTSLESPNLQAKAHGDVLIPVGFIAPPPCSESVFSPLSASLFSLSMCLYYIKCKNCLQVCLFTMEHQLLARDEPWLQSYQHGDLWPIFRICIQFPAPNCGENKSEGKHVIVQRNASNHRSIQMTRTEIIIL